MSDTEITASELYQPGRYKPVLAVNGEQVITQADDGTGSYECSIMFESVSSKPVGLITCIDGHRD